MSSSKSPFDCENVRVAPFKVKSIVDTVHRIYHVLSKETENSVESGILFFNIKKI